MKTKLLTAAAVLLSFAVLTGCQSDTSSADTLQAETAESGESAWETVDFSQDMGGYSINVAIPVRKSSEDDTYDVSITNDMVFVQDDSGNVISSIIFNNPYVGGTKPCVDDPTGFTFEAVSLDSGNLLFVGTPVGDDPMSVYCLSVYYFDSSYVNFIGYQEYGGDFFPVVSGEIETEGDTFTLTEVEWDSWDDSDSYVFSTVTYTVDFDKKILSSD